MKPLTVKDLNPKGFPQAAEITSNLTDLANRVNELMVAYGKQFVVTSGLRSKDDQIRIYKAKGITDLKLIPMGSKHLSGQAVDISDPKKDLQAWCLKNVEVLKDIGLWCEDFGSTPNWVHLQSAAPKSGKRFFKP
jgi:uncharacterized protein YcbK (DUF882 family)